MKISIITVCFNAALTIENTLKSVKKLKEQDDNIEYIVIDGQSTDETNLIISRYQDIIDIFVSEPDSGMYDALNKGIKLSSSEWVMLLAADDCIIPKGIELFRDTVKLETDIWCGSLVCQDQYGFFVHQSSNELEKLRDCCVLRNPASVFKKSIFYKFGFYDTNFKCNGDGELFYRMYINNVSFQIENIPMVIFGLDGMSSDSTQYAIPERAMIYKKYGLMLDEDIEKWKKNAIRNASIKQLLKKNMLIKKLLSNKKRYLAKEELFQMGVV